MNVWYKEMFAFELAPIQYPLSKQPRRSGHITRNILNSESQRGPGG